MSDNESFDDGANSTDSAVSVVKIGGKSYAVGLLWNEVSDKTEGAKEARAMAARPSVEADLYAMRTSGDQFGLGWRRNGHAKGMASLAGHMADARAGTQGSWLGLFEVDEGYYLVAVRDEVILAQTDKVYADEMAARNQIEDLLGTDWSEFYAPESMGFDNATAMTAASLVSAGKSPRLVDVDKVSGIVKWGAAVLAVLVLILGGLWYQNYAEGLRLEEEAAELAREAAKNLPMGNRQAEIQVPPPPWTDRFVAGKFLAGCSEAMNAAVLNFPGWKATKLECDGKSTGGPVMAKLVIDRASALGKGGGTINWVRWTLDRSPSMAKASAMPTGDNSVAISWAGPEVERNKLALTSKSADIGKARFYMQSWFEEAFTPITFPTAEANQFYRSNKFKFETTYDPVKFSTILDRMPGTTIDKVSVELGRAPVTYSVEGSINEDLPLPEGARVTRAGSPQASAAAVRPPAPKP